MTVRELIDDLSKCPPDAEVKMSGDGFSLGPSDECWDFKRVPDIQNVSIVGDGQVVIWPECSWSEADRDEEPEDVESVS